MHKNKSMFLSESHSQRGRGRRKSCTPLESRLENYVVGFFDVSYSLPRRRDKSKVLRHVTLKVVKDSTHKLTTDNFPLPPLPLPPFPSLIFSPPTPSFSFPLFYSGAPPINPARGPGNYNGVCMHIYIYIYIYIYST